MGTVKKFENPAALFDGAAKFILQLAQQAGPKFSISLAGGTTPRALYERMAAPDMRGSFPWEKMHFFFGDERCVPHEDPRSNYRMARESMLGPAAVPAGNVHPVNTSTASAAASAQDYAGDLEKFFGKDLPRFDLILLGLGEDGHTASLFPGDPALLENKKWTAPAKVETPEPRVTLTYPVINNADNVMFLVSGESKKKILSEVLPGNSNYPSGKIKPSSGSLYWFIS